MAALMTNLILQPHQFLRQNMESTDREGSISLDSSENFDRDSPNIDNVSCCSDDTVLSVGNEQPPVPAAETGTLSFKHIESHLNAISQITNSTLNPDLSLRSPSSPVNSRLSPCSTKSAPNFCSSDIFRRNLCSPRSVSSPESAGSLETSPRRQEFIFNPNVNKDTANNEVNNGSLKFSIDNILKADFGRRITDPINIRKQKPKKVVPECIQEATKPAGPVDLSKSEDKAKTEEKPPILWPAWVYCTRYSDRPSSGEFKIKLATR